MSNVTPAIALQGFLQQWQAAPFAWPDNHCGHFIVAWIRHATGRVVAMPACCDAMSARRALREFGDDLAEACRRLHGGAPIAPALAETGDIVLVPTPLASGVGAALGICSGRHVIVIGVDGATLFLPMTEARAAWRLQ